VDLFFAVGPLAPMLAIRGVAFLCIGTVIGLTWMS
jgi:hypothetical protein